MNIETTEDLCNQIADWLGVYGACKASDDNLEKANGCENENPLCCRVGFMMVMKERMINAVENDKKLEMLNGINLRCDGCNVRDPWEHRCHGGVCKCDNPVCMKQQGRITQEQLMEIVNRELNQKSE